MRTMIVTGTGTGVGKTVVTAAVAALAHAAGERVVVVKPAQTGLGADEPGDLADVTRLSGVTRTLELARYPDPLAPATAARRAGAPALTAASVVAGVVAVAGGADLVLVEGAGGLLVRLNDGPGAAGVGAAGTGATGGNPPAGGRAGPDRAGAGESLADVAVGLRAAGVDAGVLLVASAGLGVLNAAALTAEALRARGVPLAGTVVGAWPAEPDLADRCNLEDLPVVTGSPLLGVLPDGLGAAAPDRFLAAARCGLGPVLGGGWSATDPS